MAPGLVEFLTEYTADTLAYPATSFWPITCLCGSDHFRLGRCGSVTQRTCSRCGTIRYIDGLGHGESWEAVADGGSGEEPYFCARCGGDKAAVCLGFAAVPAESGLAAAQWLYVGVRCCVCSLDACFNQGKMERGSMAEAHYREVTGKAGGTETAGP